VLRLPSVDAGGGWLIFALPPAEMGVHPTDGDEGPSHQLYLLCDDITTTVADLRSRGVEFVGDVSDQGWGLLENTATAAAAPRFKLQSLYACVVPGVTGATCSAQAASCLGVPTIEFSGE